MSEMSDISTENAAAAGSSSDNTMMRGVTDKVVTSSSFSERVKNTLGFFFHLVGEQEQVTKYSPNKRKRTRKKRRT